MNCAAASTLRTKYKSLRYFSGLTRKNSLTMSSKTQRESILLILVLLGVFLGLSTVTAAHGMCANPTEISELRVLKSKKCVDIAGASGWGNVATYNCDGLDDQQIIMCDDGTIRNVKARSNCLSAGKHGNGNVVSTSCKLFPAIPDYQKWRFGKSKTFTDNGGIVQEAREIINVKSGKCLDVTGRSGRGNIGTYTCDNLYDQYFFFRSRGNLLAHGRLKVERSGLCLDVPGNQGGRGHHKNVILYHCENLPDQYFFFYENGELVNKKSRLCLDVSGNRGSGNVGMFACDELADQRWSRPWQSCHCKYCSFRNEKSGKCLDVSGSAAKSGSNVLAYRCDGRPDQRFRWIA